METNKNGLGSYFKRFLGEPIAVLCCRYWYRGIVAEVLDDSVILSNPYAVEVMGPAAGARVETEDRIPSDICILFQAAEIVMRPAWAFYGYETKKEEGK